MVSITEIYQNRFSKFTNETRNYGNVEYTVGVNTQDEVVYFKFGEVSFHAPGIGADRTPFKDDQTRLLVDACIEASKPGTTRLAFERGYRQRLEQSFGLTAANKLNTIWQQTR